MKCGIGVDAEIQATSRSFISVAADVQRDLDYGDSEMLSRTSRAIYRLGTPIKIIKKDNRIIDSYAILVPLQRVSSPKTIQLIRIAWFIGQIDIEGGDLILDVLHNKYFLFLTESEIEKSSEIVVTRSTVAVCNHVADHYKVVEQPSGAGGITSRFERVENDVLIALEFVRPGMRMEEPGLFQNSSHRCFVRDKHDVGVLDQLRIKGDNFIVNDIDTTTFPGMLHCVLSRDRRQS